MLKLSCGILVLSLSVSLHAAPNPWRLSRDVVPVSQSVSLKLDAARDDYSGTTTVELDVAKPVRSFRFNSEGIHLDEVTLTGPKGKKPVKFAEGEHALVTVSASDLLAAGHYRLEIAFHHAFGTRAVGLYKVSKDGEGYAFTQFESADARKAFPCWDEPSFKIPWQITLTVPVAHQALSNTPIEKETTADGWRTVVFKRTRPLPSYLVAFATGPLEFVPIKGLPFPARIVTVKGQSQLATLAPDVIAPIIKAEEKYFTIPYPYEKLDLIAVPEFWAGAMENPGAITFRDSILLIDAKTATPAQRKSLVNIAAHELAHMWFGDLVTMKWWDDLWLNESFADWFGDKITAQLHPEYKMELSGAESTQEIMAEDARPSTDPIRQPVEFGDNALNQVGLAYDKGKAVLNMFEHYVGEETFRQGIIAYLKAHEDSNATESDLSAALSKASGKNLGAAMSGYIEQSGFPLVNVYRSGPDSFRVDQKRFLNFGTKAADELWIVPVTLRVSMGGRVTEKRVLLDKPSTVVMLGGNVDWILPDSGMNGYYRWNVEPELLRALARHAAEVLSPRERIGVIGNLSALLDAGKIHGDTYVACLAEFANDPEPQVINALLEAMDKIKTAFITDDLKPRFAKVVRQTLAPSVQRFGLEPKEGEDPVVTSFRPQLIQWLVNEGKDPAVTEYAQSLGRKTMQDPASVHPTLAGVGLAALARSGDQTLFDEYRKRFENAKTPFERNRYLAALGAFEDPAIRDEALRYSLEGPLRSTELFTIPVSMDDPDRIYDFVTSHYETIASRIPNHFVSGLVFVARGCDSARLDKAKAFFAEPKHHVQDTDKELAKVANQVGDCVSLRTREGAAVAKALSESN